MNRWLLHVVVLIACVFVVFGCGDVQRTVEPQEFPVNASRTPSGALAVSVSEGTVDLVAGRTEVIGAVEWRVEGNMMYVRYVTNGNWKLAATHLVVAESLDDVPTTNGGNPKVGHFPFSGEHVPPVAVREYALTLDEWGLDDVDEVIIAAHADVVLCSERGGADREEGAWGNGTRFSESEADNPDGKGNTGDTTSGGGNWAMYFRVEVKEPTTSGLLINEIFYAGSDASSFYFYDQFVELHNSSNSTIYLDGIIITRQAQSTYPDQETAPFVRAIYAYQFPGTPVTGRQYPVQPGEFVVIAADAVNHKQWCQKSIDLSHADWEFFNPLSSDYDNPAVPNIVNINPSSKVDYLINLTRNAVVIATGEEYEYEEYDPGKFHVRIPIETIIDGVEYAASASSTKELTSRVDAGLAGIGCTRYSGQSVERGEPGLDTNNSTVDFLLTAHPTPGYSYFEGNTGDRTLAKRWVLSR
jgi:hypothetical protein